VKEYKKNFITFLMQNNALKFGDFTLKSGRKSPYFLNTGMLYSGAAVTELGRFYAAAIMDNLPDQFNVVFGPAYKGIPLAVGCVYALYEKFNQSADYTFNRKEAKDHGDTGLLVGKKLTAEDRLVIVDDVITAGTAVRETLEILAKEGNPKISAVVVSVDRMEKGTGEKSAIQELNESTGIRFVAIATIKDIIEYLTIHPQLEISGLKSAELVTRMEEYRRSYGVDY